MPDLHVSPILPLLPFNKKMDSRNSNDERSDVRGDLAGEARVRAENKRENRK